MKLNVSMRCRSVSCEKKQWLDNRVWSIFRTTESLESTCNSSSHSVLDLWCLVAIDDIKMCTCVSTSNIITLILGQHVVSSLITQGQVRTGKSIRAERKWGSQMNIINKMKMDSSPLSYFLLMRWGSLIQSFFYNSSRSIQNTWPDSLLICVLMHLTI